MTVSSKSLEFRRGDFDEFTLDDFPNIFDFDRPQRKEQTLREKSSN